MSSNHSLYFGKFYLSPDAKDPYPDQSPSVMVVLSLSLLLFYWKYTYFPQPAEQHLTYLKSPNSMSDVCVSHPALSP